MRFEEDEKDLTKRFSERMAVLLPGMRIDWPNKSLTGENTGPWENWFVRFRISRLPDSRFIATQGDIKCYRNYGSVILQVVGPFGIGPGKHLGVVDELSSIFVSWRKGGMLSRTPSAGPIVEDKSAASITVSVPYQSDFRVNKEGELIP